MGSVVPAAMQPKRRGHSPALAILPPPLTLSLSSHCLLLQGDSEKKLQFCTRLPRRNAKWMRMSGRMGLPIMWVSEKYPCPSLVGKGGDTERQDPVWAPLTQCQLRPFLSNEMRSLFSTWGQAGTDMYVTKGTLRGVHGE